MVADDGFDLPVDRHFLNRHINEQGDGDPPDHQGDQREDDPAGGQSVADEKRHDRDHHPLEGDGLDQRRQPAGTEATQYRQERQGQNRVDRVDHFRNSSVMMVAKKASAKEVSTNWGTLSMR